MGWAGSLGSGSYLGCCMLPIEYFEPFDRTYRLVTQRIRERTANFSPDEIRWMERLIVEFQYERDR